MMAKATTKAAVSTTLVIGKVEVAVGLFTTVAKPGKLQEFTTAGPNGGVLKAQARARPVPVREIRDEAPDVPVHSVDPFADDPPERWSAEHATHMEAVAAGDPVAIDAERMVERDPAWMPVIADPESKHEIRVGYPRSDELPSAVEPTPATTVDGEYGRELVEDGTGVVVAPDQVRRGVRREDGSFVDCTEQLAEIERRTRLERMEVVRFVDITQIPRARVTGTYYVGVGDEHAGLTLRVLFEALRSRRRAAVVKLTKRSRQSLGVIGWLGGSLMLYELVWAEDFREPPARARMIQSVAVTTEQVSRMCDLVDAMGAGIGALDELRDDAIELRERLREAALRGEVEPVEPVSAPAPDTLLQQLEASLAGVG